MSQNPINNSTSVETEKFPKIAVIGLGGGGCNAINRMVKEGLHNVKFIAANTDKQVLTESFADITIHLGQETTRGLGAGGSPTVGEMAAKESTEEIKAALAGAELVFLTAGMGGGTGTGAIPVVAKLAKDVGAVTISIVTTPFEFEGSLRKKYADIGLVKLNEFSDTLITIPNDKLSALINQDMTLEAGFVIGDEILHRGVQGVSELLTEVGLINVNFSHIKRIMSHGGKALVAVGTGSGPNKVQQAIENALHHPLMDDVDLFASTNMIANFSGNEKLGFREVTRAMQTLQEASGYHAEIVPGIITNNKLDDKVQLILIVTGIGGSSGKGDDVQKTTTETISTKNPGNSSNKPATDLTNSTNTESSNIFVKPTGGNNRNDVNLPAYLRNKKNLM